jgi:hypothetical protein
MDSCKLSQYTPIRVEMWKAGLNIYSSTDMRKRANLIMNENLIIFCHYHNGSLVIDKKRPGLS